MPELPEVETIKRQLEKVLTGEVISDVQVLRPKSFQGCEDDLLKKRISQVLRKAKMIIIKFQDWDKVLMIHLKMTGQLVWLGPPVAGQSGEAGPTSPSLACRQAGLRRAGGHPTVDWVGNLPSKHTRVIISFKSGSKLFFNDLRVFGWMKILSIGHFSLIIDKLPPDVVDDKFILEYFKRVMNGSGRMVKLVLLDQAKMGGVGNIYANDALFLAKILPKRKASSLSLKETKRLFKAVKQVIGEGVKYGGATAADDRFVDIQGFGGKYQEHFRVYERKGEKCGVCGSEIEKINLGGRGTYFCPMCQT